LLEIRSDEFVLKYVLANYHLLPINTFPPYNQGRQSHGGNEAEIFIIAILGENKFSAILGEMFLAFYILEGKEILVHERLGEVFRGKCTYLGKKGKM